MDRVGIGPGGVTPTGVRTSVSRANPAVPPRIWVTTTRGRVFPPEGTEGTRDVPTGVAVGQPLSHPLWSAHRLRTLPPQKPFVL